MKSGLLRFRFTCAAVVFAFIVIAAVLIGQVNLIEIPLSGLTRVEQSEVDEIATAFGLVVVALIVDRIRNGRREGREAKRLTEQRESERLTEQSEAKCATQAEQLRVVHVTMRTVQDIVNNCLNQIQLFRLDAEGFVSEETLKRFDQAIEDTTAKLQELGNLEVFAEKQMAVGSGLHVRASAVEE